MRAIACLALNHVIGKDGKIPWRIPADLAWFKKCTTGGIVLMGGKTFESLGYKPLPNRINVVLSRDPAKGMTVEEAVDTYKDNKSAWVIGGGEIYRKMLPYCSELYLSVLHREVEGDTYFPRVEEADWCFSGVLEKHTEFDVHLYSRHPYRV